MKHIFALILVLAAANCRAATQPGDTTGINSATAVTVASDTIIDDTADYVVSTHIPKGFVRMFGNFADEAESGFLFPSLKWIFPMIGIAGAGMILVFILIILFPLLVAALLVWYVLRNRRKARNEDLRRQTATAAPGESTQENGETAQQTVKRNCLHRRDNAIRNICIGGGVTAFSLLTGLTIIALGGIVVLCIGISDYMIYRNHRNNEM